MHHEITTASLEADFMKLGLCRGDAVLIRAGLGAVGRVDRKSFIQALLNVVGEDGTIISLAFTPAAYPWKVSNVPPFTLETPSYAGALPNSMLRHAGSYRSMHPQCSYVAIGKHARYLTSDHGPRSGAYEPVRKLIELKGKMMLVGCVYSSPGFTTTHLAEFDLGLTNRIIAPWLAQSRYVDSDGNIKIFKRGKDIGFCSQSFWKFYAHYVRNEILTAGFVGKAYSICADAEQCYEIEKSILKKDPKFNTCDSPDCAMCNLLRWDRAYRWPVFVFRRIAGLHKTAKRRTREISE
jgi:aminoglycoside N3'-acetyltransferase